MKIKTLLIIAMLSGSASLTACETNLTTMEKSEATIQNEAQKTLLAYLKAGDQSNVTKIDQLTHKNYRVIFNDLEKEQVSTIDKVTYMELIEKKVFGGIPRDVKVLSNDIMGDNIASFKVKTSSDGGVFYSYFSLVKHEGKWLVLQDLIYKEL